MTIPFTGTGGLFTILGKVGKVLKDCNIQGNTTLKTDLANLDAQFVGASAAMLALIAPVDQGFPGQLAATSQPMSLLQTLSTGVVNQLVFQDNPLSSSSNLSLSMAEVIRQMILNGQTVGRCTVTAVPSARAGITGTGNVVCSVLRGDGLNQENMFAEVGYLTCNADSYRSGLAAGSEQFNFAGELAQSSLFDSTWPLGSGASVSLTAVSGALNNTGGNLVNNGDFENWTASVPNNWVVTAGAGQVAKATVGGNFYTGAASLSFVGDSSTLTGISQTFNLSSGTLAKLTPDTVYLINFWLKMSVVPAAGVLSITLVDGSGNPINDDQGNSNATAIALTGATTGFLPYSAAFRVPKAPPATMAIKVVLTTAITTGSTMYLDRLAMSQGTLLYQGGPIMSVFSGATPFIVGDVFLITTTNDRFSRSQNATFQTLFDRLFGMRGLGLLLPSTLAGPTISDSLIA